MLQLELGTLPEPIQRVVSQLLELLSSQQSNHRLHWRYELMASAILMFLLPPVDDSTAKVGREFACCATLAPLVNAQVYGEQLGTARDQPAFSL